MKKIVAVTGDMVLASLMEQLPAPDYKIVLFHQIQSSLDHIYHSIPDLVLIDLQPGDRLYFHSDGLTEEVNAHDDEFGDERLLDAIASGQSLSLQDSVESLVQKVVTWRGEEHLKDDVSILAVSVG